MRFIPSGGGSLSASSAATRQLQDLRPLQRAPASGVEDEPPTV
jgi:hypothetical protein